MKGLVLLPQLSDLERAYTALLHDSPAPPSEQELALYTQWSRFDARLAEICVDYFVKNWPKLNPVQLRTSMLSQPWPAALGVLLEFAKHAVRTADSVVFQQWKKTALADISPAPWEQFFVAQRPIASVGMLEDARFSLKEYRDWGYFGREVLFNKPEIATHPTHSFERETRLEILKDLSEKHPRITTEMYLDALHYSISRRQAERDLRAAPGLRPHGSTKGRYYQVVRRIAKRASKM